MDWPTVPLSELLCLVSDGHRVQPEDQYPNVGIYGFARGVFRKPPIDGAKTSASTLYRIKRDQFIYSRLFAFEGAYALVPDVFDGAFVSNEYPTFDVDQDRLNRRYLLWTLKRPEVWREIALGSKGMGDRRQRVHPDQVLRYKIVLPPLDEQHRIVDQLDRVATQVEERRREIETAERETHAMLLKAFQRAIEGAPLRPMAEAAPLVRRPVEVEPDQTYMELGVRSFGRGTFHKPGLAGMEVGSKKLFTIKSGDLVFNIVFAWEGAVAIAKPEDDGRVGSHRFLTCVTNPDVVAAEFLLFYFRTPEGLQKLGEASPGGAGRNRTLGLKKLEVVEVPIPPIETQHWFSRLQAKAQEIRSIRMRTTEDVDALMPALLHEVFRSEASAA